MIRRGYRDEISYKLSEYLDDNLYITEEFDGYYDEDVVITYYGNAILYIKTPTYNRMEKLVEEFLDLLKEKDFQYAIFKLSIWNDRLFEILEKYKENTKIVEDYGDFYYVIKL